MTEDQQAGRRMPPTPKFPRIQIVTPDTLTAIRAASDRWKKQFQEIDKAMAGVRKQFETDLAPIRNALASLQDSWKPFFSECLTSAPMGQFRSI